jgi:hypothetical protein
MAVRGTRYCDAVLSASVFPWLSFNFCLGMLAIADALFPLRVDKHL